MKSNKKHVRFTTISPLIYCKRKQETFNPVRKYNFLRTKQGGLGAEQNQQQQKVSNWICAAQLCFVQ